MICCTDEVNRFRLISVIDVIIRQRFDAISREEFLRPLKEFSKKLKIYGETKRNSVERSEEDAKSKEGHLSKSKAEKDVARRERLISAMLIEPEVLHVISVFEHVFQTLFKCYAPSGQMHFSDLWQFCLDFQLAPHFLTEQQLRKAYEAAECLIILPPRLVREPPRAKKQTARDAKKHKSKPHSAPPASSSSIQSVPPAPSSLDMRMESERTERARDSVLSGAARTSTASSVSNVEESEMLVSETIFGPHAFAETLCRVSFLYLSFYGSTLQQSSSSYFKVSWLLTFLRRVSGLMQESKESLTGGAAAVQGFQFSPDFWEPKQDHFDGFAVLQPQPGPGNRKAARRRSKQQSMAPRLKPSKETREAAQSLNKQKTLSTIREAVRNLGKAALVVKTMSESQHMNGVIPRKMNDSSSEEDLPIPSRPGPSVGKNELGALTTRVAASFQKSKKPRRSPQARLPLDELFKVEAGRPAIVNGICQLCEKQGGTDALQTGSWGNPRCRGCAVVDAIDLKAHPFARLLRPDCGTNAKILRPKANPQLGTRLRSAFQPPASMTCVESNALLD